MDFSLFLNQLNYEREMKMGNDVVIDVTWIFICITLCPFVLCAHVFALYLLKKDRSFRNIQKYLIGTLCITEILLVISLLIRGVDILYSRSGFEIAILFGETTVWLMYFFLNDVYHMG